MTANGRKRPVALLLALASAAAVSAGACGHAATPRQSVQAAEAGMKAELDAMVAALGTTPRSTSETVKQHCAMYAENGSSVFLTRTLRLPGAPGAVETIRGRVLPAYQQQGWRVKNRGGGEEVGFTLERGLYALTMNMRPDGRGDIVVTGGTHCFEPTRP